MRRLATGLVPGIPSIFSTLQATAYCPCLVGFCVTLRIDPIYPLLIFFGGPLLAVIGVGGVIFLLKWLSLIHRLKVVSYIGSRSLQIYRASACNRGTSNPVRRYLPHACWTDGHRHRLGGKCRIRTRTGLDGARSGAYWIFSLRRDPMRSRATSMGPISKSATLPEPAADAETPGLVLADSNSISN